MTITTTSRKILLEDDFSASQTNADIWKINEWKPGDDNASFYNLTQIRQSLPVSKDGHLLLQLDTFHAGNLSHEPSFYGSEAITRQTFDLSNGPVAFEARVCVEQDQPGIVVGFFTFAGPRDTHDEIDIELMTKMFGKVYSNIYHNRILDEGDPKAHELPGGGTLMDFYTYRIEWYPNLVVWKVDGAVVRTETADKSVPDKAMNMHLNIWGSPAEWPFGDASLTPTKNATENRTFFAKVDKVTAEQLASVTGTDAAETLIGGPDNDYLNAGAGDDLIRGGVGDDVIDGGAGHDRVGYEGQSSSYAISIDRGQGAIQIVDRSGASGSDLVLNVEEAEFADGVIRLVDLTASALLDQKSLAAVIDLYTAYLDRAPDALGLHYWAAALARGVDVESIADFFFHEARDTNFAGLDGAGVVRRAYDDIFGRQASLEEVGYWLGHAEANGLSISQLPRILVESVRHAGNDDLAPVALKTALSAYFALEKGLGDLASARALHDVTDLAGGVALADLTAGRDQLTVQIVGLDLSAFGLSL
jgi:hypothetical protein